MALQPSDIPGAVQRLSDAFFTVDDDWRFTYVNEFAAHQWNRSAESLIGRNMWHEFPLLDASPFGPVYRRAKAENVSLSFASEAPQDGRWYEVHIHPMHSGISGCFRDVSDVRTTKASLAELACNSERERRMYETVLSSTPDYSYVFDLDARFVFANTSLLRLWNKTPEEIIGKTLFELVDVSGSVAGLDSQVREVIRTGCPIQDESVFEVAGETMAYDYIFVPIVDASGRVEAVAGTTRDITKRKRLELALRNDARRKDEFLATLAHELRNPLAPIRNALEVSRLSNGNEAVIEQAHDIMERQLANMVRLIDDLLDLSRISLGKVELRRTPLDLALVVASAVETARPHIEQGGHDLRLNIPANVLLVNADATRLAQVFSNLLTNAAKFTPRNGHIVLTVSRSGANAVVSVKDNGVGIAAPMLASVFEMFTQAPDTKDRAQGGLGIGLTLASGLVHLHDGMIEAHSDGVGKGSEFVVTLPLQARQLSFDEPEQYVAPVSVATWQHILIVDDNADSAASLSMMLNMMGHETATANDGVQALAIAESFVPDVCLLDIGMPNLNGYEMAKRMRQEPWGANILLVALTGWGQEENKRRSADAGIDFHLVKPVSPSELVALLERHSSQKILG